MRLLRAAHAPHRTHRAAALLASPAWHQPHQPWTTPSELMNPPACHASPSQSHRQSTAGKSTSTKRKTRPNRPSSPHLSGSKNLNQSLFTSRLERTASKIPTDAEVGHEAIDSVGSRLPHPCGAAWWLSVSRLPSPLGSHKRPQLRQRAPVTPPRGYPFGLCGMTSRCSVWGDAAVAARQCSTTISFGVLRNQS